MVFSTIAGHTIAPIRLSLFSFHFFHFSPPYPNIYDPCIALPFSISTYSSMNRSLVFSRRTCSWCTASLICSTFRRAFLHPHTIHLIRSWFSSPLFFSHVYIAANFQILSYSLNLYSIILQKEYAVGTNNITLCSPAFSGAHSSIHQYHFIYSFMFLITFITDRTFLLFPTTGTAFRQ